MVLGRLFHYTFDIVLLSTVLAGVKRHTGFQCVRSLLFVKRWCARSGSSRLLEATQSCGATLGGAARP